MTTVTWGSGGTYSNLKAALDAQTFGSDDFLLEQVGTATDSANISLVNYDLGGYTLIVRGNGDLWTCSTTASQGTITLGGVTGNIYFEDLNIDVNQNPSYPFFNVTYLAAVTGNFDFHFRRCTVDLYGRYFLTATAADKVFANIYVYANDFTLSYASALDWFSITGLSAYTSIYIEDNILMSTSTSFSGFMKAGNSIIASQISMRRNYFGLNLIGSFFADDTSALVVNGPSDNFSATEDSRLDATNDEIAFSTDNFESLIPSELLYARPKMTSILYTGASQTTDIADNIVGINGYTVDHMAAGPYTPLTIVNPPTGVSTEYGVDGVTVTWTDTVQSGYEKVYLYWETVPVESAFATSKANVNGGVETYTIPYSELTSSAVWYLRLKHGA